MKIIIVGAGKVGQTLIKNLSAEGHDIVVIDNDHSVLSNMQDIYDVAIVEGNGAASDVQNDAETNEADLLIAVTYSDEINLLCCIVARKLGCKNTIARVRNPEYDEQMIFLKDELGLSLAVNPEKSAAKEMVRILQFPSFLKRDTFAKGRVELIEIKIKEDSLIAGKRLDQFVEMRDLNALVCAVDRNGEVIIPTGEFSFKKDDKVTVAADVKSLFKLMNILNISSKKVKRVMIIGGSRIAEYLAAILLNQKVEVTIIEEDAQRCNELCDALPKALIINGNGTLQELLISEDIKEMDAVVTLTGIDEENLIMSMFADYIGVPKTITKINRTEYNAIFESKGIDTIVSPKVLIANEIIRYVRAISASEEAENIKTLYKIVDQKAEALEFSVTNNTKHLNTPLADLKLKKNILLACIIREGNVIIPNGSDFMQEGDSVIIVTTTKTTLSKLSDIFIK